MSEWIISTEDIDDITGGGFTVGQKLVRCKDCKSLRFYEDGTWWCEQTEREIINPDWFCADGERKCGE